MGNVQFLFTIYIINIQKKMKVHYRGILISITLGLLLVKLLISFCVLIVMPALPGLFQI